MARRLHAVRDQGGRHSRRGRRRRQGWPAADDARLRLFGREKRTSRSIPSSRCSVRARCRSCSPGPRSCSRCRQASSNLDADINTYLDFKIPPRDGKPITLRNLMTHTPGFAETAKYLIDFGREAPQAARPDSARAGCLTRIYAPGTMPAYSNYGASVAGYIVERVSGEPFDAYVAAAHLRAAGMTHSTLRPAAARGAAAATCRKGYKPGSDEPQPYEVIGMAPAGSARVDRRRHGPLHDRAPQPHACSIRRRRS